LPVLAVATVAAAFATAAGAASKRQQVVVFRSLARGASVRFHVYLPPAYETRDTHYPVLYFLHGLPASAEAYRSLGFLEHALDAAGRPAILVVPQGARTGDTDPEYLDRGRGRRWETAIAQELPRVVDSRFRTIAARRGRALLGLSAGGYGAMHLALEHLRTFSVVESWSGYFHPTDPSGTRPLDLGSADADAAADVHAQLVRARSQLRSLPTFIAFYVGRDDARFAAENRQLDVELSRLRIPHVFRVYPGGHDQRLWSAHAVQWLSLALGHLASAT
jgi:enterochelin esterase-like enzyme